MKGEGKGYGKAIIFGEHFVVYGLPGIAAAIDRHVKATIEKAKSGVTIEDRVFNETVSTAEKEHIKIKVLAPAFAALQAKDIKITIDATSIPSAGMGYSASLAVAVIRALLEFKGMHWSDDQVYGLAYECEGAAHGTPSGIDPACATYGGVIWFEKNMAGGRNKIVPMKPAEQLKIVLGDTGIKKSTKETVTAVRERKEKDPEKYEKIFSEYRAIAPEAKTALLNGEIEKIGALMNKNQELLRQIGVSCGELEELCKTALDNGAVGAKLTGGGCGGLMLALVKTAKDQDKVCKAIEEKGFTAIKTAIG